MTHFENLNVELDSASGTYTVVAYMESLPGFRAPYNEVYKRVPESVLATTLNAVYETAISIAVRERVSPDVKSIILAHGSAASRRQREKQTPPPISTVAALLFVSSALAKYNAESVENANTVDFGGSALRGAHVRALQHELRTLHANAKAVLEENTQMRAANAHMATMLAIKAEREAVDKDHNDMVTRPAHYMLPGLDIEVIDVRDSLAQTIPDGTSYAIAGYYLEAVAYVMRMWRKGFPAQDAKKAMYYLERIAKNLEGK